MAEHTKRGRDAVLGGQIIPPSMNQSIINQQINRLNFLMQASVYLIFFITTSLLHKFAVLSDYSLGIINTITSLVQAPLMLVLLFHFSTTNSLRSLMKKSLTVLLAASILIMAYAGTSEPVLFSIMLMGSIPVFVFSSILFGKYIKKSMSNKNETTNAVVLSAVVFAFGSYILLLSLNMVNPTKHELDLRSIIGLITIISAAVMSVSLALSQQEVKQPAKQQFATPASAGFAQWENFSLSNTPDMMKNSVTDISRYYSGLQKTN
jgi:hypothetical protein